MNIRNVLMNDLRESILYPIEILRKDSQEIRNFVMNRLAITNCKRILLSYPLLVLLLLQNVFILSTQNTVSSDLSSYVLTGIIFAFSTIYCSIIIWIIYLNNIDNQKELWKCKILHRTYWPLFIATMFPMSFMTLQKCNRGYLFVGTILFICLVPLYHIVEYLLTATVSIIAIYLGMHKCGYSFADNNVLFHALIALIIVSYFAQISQRNSAVFKEYISSTAFFDPLTKLLNRRGAERFLEVETKKMIATSQISLFMIDIDYFKKYNDAFGHDAGDECLKSVAKCIRDTLHEHTKLLIRQGGEEFTVILPNTDSQKAFELAEQLRTAVYSLGIATACQMVAPVVTISMGVATVAYSTNFSIETLMKKADDALYRAKEAGRNQVMLAE